MLHKSIKYTDTATTCHNVLQQTKAYENHGVECTLQPVHCTPTKPYCSAIQSTTVKCNGLRSINYIPLLFGSAQSIQSEGTAADHLAAVNKGTELICDAHLASS